MLVHSFSLAAPIFTGLIKKPKIQDSVHVPSSVRIDVPLVEFMYLVFTRMLARRLRSLLLYLLTYFER